MEPEIKGDTKSIINRRQLLKALHQQFHVRWKQEHLKELHKRNKWQAPVKNLSVGDLVIREENQPSIEWRLADGNVRVLLPEMQIASIEWLLKTA